MLFQSTLPARGATYRPPDAMRANGFQSTLPARGATRSARFIMMPPGFQSTLPARGATLRRCRERNLSLISIHAPRTGSDEYRQALSQTQHNFNPRSPHGERRNAIRCTRYGKKFQSTLPARGATRSCLQILLTKRFQSTLPARGATRSFLPSECKILDFNPRSPHGERLKPLLIPGYPF